MDKILVSDEIREFYQVKQVTHIYDECESGIL